MNAVLLFYKHNHIQAIILEDIWGRCNWNHFVKVKCLPFTRAVCKQHWCWSFLRLTRLKLARWSLLTTTGFSILEIPLILCSYFQHHNSLTLMNPITAYYNKSLLLWIVLWDIDSYYISKSIGHFFKNLVFLNFNDVVYNVLQYIKKYYSLICFLSNRLICDIIV